jgi:hypothetical protein
MSHTLAGQFYFRYRIARSCFRWSLRTEEEWYLCDTEEEAIALRDKLRDEARREWEAANNQQEETKR